MKRSRPLKASSRHLSSLTIREMSNIAEQNSYMAKSYDLVCPNKLTFHCAPACKEGWEIVRLKLVGTKLVPFAARCMNDLLACDTGHTPNKYPDFKCPDTSGTSGTDSGTSGSDTETSGCDSGCDSGTSGTDTVPPKKHINLL